jgi:hypothetical protein
MDSCTMSVFMAGVVQMTINFWVCSDIVEECSAFVCGEMTVAQADDEVSGKNQPTNQPTNQNAHYTRTSAACSHMRTEGIDGLLTQQQPYVCKWDCTSGNGCPSWLRALT